MKNQTENEMVHKYEVSRSTIKRIARSQKLHTMKYKTHTISTYLEWLNSDNVMTFIVSFIKKNKTSLTVLDIWRQIEEELQITIKPHVIRRVLKESIFCLLLVDIIPPIPRGR